MLARLWWLCALIVLASCGLAPADTTTTAPRSTTGLLAQTNGNPRALGDPSAPIKMYEFSDYQ